MKNNTSIFSVMKNNTSIFSVMKNNTSIFSVMKNNTSIFSVMKNNTSIFSVMKNNTSIFSVMKNNTSIFSVMKNNTSIFSVMKNNTSIVSVMKNNTSIFSVMKSRINDSTTLNEDLYLISKWAYSWKMSFNSDPSKQAIEIIFSIKHSNIQLPVMSFNNNISAPSSHKHLGMILDSKRNFKNHLTEKIYKAYKGIV